MGPLGVNLDIAAPVGLAIEAVYDLPICNAQWLSRFRLIVAEVPTSNVWNLFLFPSKCLQ